jgi:CheY-like chemotaxis protein
LLNLTGNAIKFTHRGSVTLSLSIEHPSPSPALHFAIRDTGMGMSPATVDGLFSPFFQADQTITRRFGGTGLGLSISQRLVELMGGTMAVESIEGQGSIFKFSIPTRPASSPLAPVAVAPNQKLLSGARILLVDDNRTNQKVAEIMLKKLGCEVCIAEDGRIALDKLASAKFDLVLMDCQMPNLDGYAATRHIRANADGHFDANIPIIAMTANAMQGDREACLVAGMNDYLSKPIVHSALINMLNQWLPAARRSGKSAR